MQVHVTNSFFADRDVELQTYIVAVLDGNDYDRGALEAAQATASNTLEAIGRLCETLLEKNIISLKDIVYIARGQSSEVLSAAEQSNGKDHKERGRKLIA